MDKTILEKISAEIEAFKKKKEELTRELMQDFPALITPLLEKSKCIETIGWSQYTPYFNDGEECIFSAQTDYEDDWDDDETPNFLKKTTYFRLKTQADIEADKELTEKLGRKYYKHNIGEYGIKLNENYLKEEEDILNNIKKVLAEIPDEFYRELFGDHTKVVIHKNGLIEKENYDHE